MTAHSEKPDSPSALPAAFVGAFFHCLVWVGAILLFVSYVGLIERTFRELAMTLPAATVQVLSAGRYLASFGPFSFAILMLVTPIDFLVLWALDRPGSLRVLRELWSTLALGVPVVAIALTAFALNLPWIKVSEGLMRAHAAQDAAVRSEMVRLQGHWTLIGMEREGKAAPPAELAIGRLTLEGEHFRLSRRNNEEGGIYELLLSGTAKQITLIYMGGPDAGHSQTGIYKLEADKLVINLAPVDAVGDELPVDYATRGTRNEVMIWQRLP